MRRPPWATLGKEGVFVVNIYDYTDYRLFLKAAYDERRKANPAFSYRFIASKTGFSSPGFFTNVLKGKKDISLKLANKLADLFRLGRKEKEYFELLVLFAKADGVGDKKEYLDRLLVLRGSQAKPVEAHQWEYFEKWYYMAVREALALKPFRGDYKALAGLIHPPITFGEARKAVEVLARLGLIQAGPDGTYERTDAVISSSDEISKVLINAYQVQAMDLAKNALETLPSGTRNFSTLSLSVNGKTYAAMIEELRAFRRKLLDMAKSSEDPDRVYQMNFQVFPLTALPPAPPPIRLKPEK